MTDKATKERKPTVADYVLKWPWVFGGLAVATLLTIADVGKTWYWFPQRIPVALGLYFTAIWFVYALWVAIAAGIGLLRERIPLSASHRYRSWFFHGGICLAVGLVHLFIETALVWAMYAPLLSFSAVYAEKLLGWLAYEILAYWAILAVFTLFALRRSQRSRPAHYQNRVAVKTDNETLIVATDEIDWFEAYDNYVIVKSNGGRHLLHDTMTRLESALDPDAFLRVHRSVIVNLRSIEKLLPDDGGRLHVRLRTGETFPVSRRRRSRVKSAVATRPQSH